jgi:hypothetical protein
MVDVLVIIIVYMVGGVYKMGGNLIRREGTGNGD